MRRKRKKEPAQEVFYARLSYPKKDERGETDLHNQVEKLRAVFGFDRPLHYEVMSGAGSRRVMRDLVEELPKGSKIYTVHLDRLSRAGIYDLLHIIATARKRGIEIWTADQPERAIDLERDEIMLVLKAFAAQQERLSAQRRIKDQMEAAKRQGKYWGIYRAIEKGEFKFGVKAVNPKYVEGIPRLMALRDAGHSYEEVARIFNKENGTTLSGTHAFRLIKRELNPPEPKPYPWDKLPVLTRAD